MGREKIILFFLFALFILAVACIPKFSPANFPENGATLSPAQSDLAYTGKKQIKEDWRVKWDDLLVAAKKEGKVVFYCSAGQSVRENIVNGFQKATGIEVEITTGGMPELAARIFAEQRANLYMPDILTGGVTTSITRLKPGGVLQPMEPAFILPELTNTELIKKTWLEGSLPWVDPESKLIFGMLAYPSPPITINTNMVKPEELASWWDLLNSKFKGKIVMYDPTIAGPGQKLFSVSSQMIVGLDFWEKLIKQNPTILRDHRLVMEWLASGKMYVAMGTRAGAVGEFLEVGAPVADVTPKEGTYVTSGIGGLHFIKNAPHPNAAKLFINWTLSKEGQIAWSKGNSAPSTRLDVSQEWVPPGTQRQPGVKYFQSDREDAILESEKYSQDARRIFQDIINKP